jgi:Phosphotransferase system cellobiose-specific component IIB
MYLRQKNGNDYVSLCWWNVVVFVSNTDEKAMVKRNLEYNIFATGVDAIPDDYRKSHPVVILIGPQVSYMLAKVRQEVDVPVEVIVSKNYGMMDGDKVLDQALKMMQ